MSKTRMLRYFLTTVSALAIPAAIWQGVLLTKAGVSPNIAAGIGGCGIILACLQLLYYVEAGKRSEMAIKMIEERDRLIEHLIRNRRK